jgi:hypothetical protein
MAENNERVRHLKRGFEYEVLGEAEAQVAVGAYMTWPDGTDPHGEGIPGVMLHDGLKLTVYRCIKTGKLWARFTDEFRDGRFETIASAPSSVAGEGETLQTIAQWCEETFGPIQPERIVSRAGEEMDELRAEPTRVEEAADVVICLARYPGLWEAVERKMAVNRARKWRLMGDGTGYHVKPTEARS